MLAHHLVPFRKTFLDFRFFPLNLNLLWFQVLIAQVFVGCYRYGFLLIECKAFDLLFDYRLNGEHVALGHTSSINQWLIGLLDDFVPSLLEELDVFSLSSVYHLLFVVIQIAGALQSGSLLD